MNLKPFKIRSSQAHKIMGRIGLTEKQEQELLELTAKPKLTAIQEKKLVDLAEKKANPELPETAVSYLKEWYSEQIYGDREEIKSKYFDKGNLMESLAIDFTAEMLGYGILDKNEIDFENDFLTGTPDIITKTEILDTKCPWNSKTFLDSVFAPLNDAYYWQMQSYMGLTGLKQAKVCFCLMDTLGEFNYGKDISYAEIPSKIKFHAKEVIFNQSDFDSISQRVDLCRKWLENYHSKFMDVFK